VDYACAWIHWDDLVRHCQLETRAGWLLQHLKHLMDNIELRKVEYSLCSLVDFTLT
jgi:hypothetical protein